MLKKVVKDHVVACISKQVVVLSNSKQASIERLKTELVVYELLSERVSQLYAFASLLGGLVT